MRNTLRTIILAALFLTAGCSRYDRELMGEPQPQEPSPAYSGAAQPETAPADSDSMNIGMFHDLDYYGQWYQRDQYGWVWRPSVVMDWQPFTHGHWIWTQYGWMWVDYDPWGWATSHYGYWYNDFTLGWVWIPDYTWSPVQCQWIEYGDYIGWAPEAPPGTAFKDPWDDSKPWVFVPVRKFKEADVAQNRMTPKFKPATDSDIARGKPALQDVERRGSGLFPQVDVQLDRRVIRDREFAKVKYPPDQQDLIAEHRTVPIKSAPMAPPTAPVQLTPGSPYTGPGDPVPPPPSVGPVQQGPPAPPHAKSKGGNSQPPAKTETKYKSQKAQERKEPASKSKDSTPAKKGKGG